MPLSTNLVPVARNRTLTRATMANNPLTHRGSLRLILGIRSEVVALGLPVGEALQIRSDHFFSMFGGQSGGGGARKPSAKEVTIDVSLQDLYTGTAQTVKVPLQRVSGSEQKIVDKDVPVKIRKGMKNGEKITMAGKGDHRLGSTEKGDLVFIVREKPHPKFSRDGDNLIYTASISLADALLGTELEIKTLDKRTLKVDLSDKVIHPEGKKTIQGEGMPKAGGGTGNLVIKFKIKFPKELSAEQKRLLREANLR
eukprot:Rmarinus@m.2969